MVNKIADCKSIALVSEVRDCGGLNAMDLKIVRNFIVHYMGMIFV